jgi:hypothetical protein
MEGQGKKKQAGVLGFFFSSLDDHDTGGELPSAARDPGLESNKKRSKKPNKSDEGDRERSATSQQPSDWLIRWRQAELVLRAAVPSSSSSVAMATGTHNQSGKAEKESGDKLSNGPVGPSHEIDPSGRVGFLMASHVTALMRPGTDGGRCSGSDHDDNYWAG